MVNAAHVKDRDRQQNAGPASDFSKTAQKCCKGTAEALGVKSRTVCSCCLVSVALRSEQLQQEQTEMFLLTGTEQNTYLSHFLSGRKLSATANAEICASCLCLHQVEYDKSCQLQVEAICKIWIEDAHFNCCTL